MGIITIKLLKQEAKSIGARRLQLHQTHNKGMECQAGQIESVKQADQYTLSL